MKKFLLLIPFLGLMTSCTFTGGSSTPSTSSKTTTIQVKVNASDWQYTNMANNNYFYAGLDLSQITDKVFEKGEVKAYRVVDRYNAQKARKHLLPYVMHKEEYIGGQWVFWTETLDFTYGKGWVEFNLRASDFAYELDATINPEAMDFDIVITEP